MSGHAVVTPPVTVVWVDSRQATIVRDPEAPDVRTFVSDVPVHRTSTGHVRYRPAIRHGGGGGQDADEPRRREHLKRFVEAVIGAIPRGERAIVMGPGQVGDEVVRELRLRGDPAEREVSDVRTTRQLIARLREAAGEPPRRVRR